MSENAGIPSATIKRPRPSLEERLYDWLGDPYCGNTTPPGSTCRFEFKHGSWPEVATTYNDDGMVLWIGTDHEWHTNMNRRDAHRLAFFILWTWWAKGEWFGLKRWAWYKLLFRRVARYDRQIP